MDLVKQLEDKKKELEEHGTSCKCEFIEQCNEKYNSCKKEIAILEQAIAEMQKQRQDFERILNRIIGKLEDGRNQREEIIDYCKNKKQQLNQPKTER